jgi:3'-phosphoadenosine 5'-phosphosulfate sulfotransferase (PAPS reductase)/FAD synthetase
VFFDTGLEFPEIREFALAQDNVIRIRPKLDFREVIAKHGYPAVSKRVAQYVSEVQRARGDTATWRRRLTGIKSDGAYTRLGKIADRWIPLALQTEIRISHRCCHVLKRDPAFSYEDESGRKPIIGTMAGEGQQRSLQWQMDGCNAFGAARPTSKPLSVWTEADVWAYLRGGNREVRPLPYSSIYDLGYLRTGCVFCAFGVHLEQRDTGTNRFLRLEKTHPALHAYCFRPWSDGGLGMRPVLEAIGVPWRQTQMDLLAGLGEGA